MKNVKEEILARLKECQKNYYKRENAVMAYRLLTDHQKMLQFKTDEDKASFYDLLERLKYSMALEDKDMFAQAFANACLKLSLLVRKTFNQET